MNRNIAWLFPGQGSQSPNMVWSWAAKESVVEETFHEASDALGYDMVSLVRDDPPGRLDRTRYTQPALLTASVALCRLWRRRKGEEASYMAGHSLGEYSALVATDALTFVDALQLVAYRGEAMERAIPADEGRMAAVLGLDDAQVVEICERCSDARHRVWPANYNCPGQLVIAGHTQAVEKAMQQCRSAGARRVLPLSVSVPSHTPLMQPAADAMQARLHDVALQRPSCPVWSNVDASPHKDPDAIRRALVAQLVSPVRWSECVRAMRAQGMQGAVEMGPGKVLSGLMRRIDRDVRAWSCENEQALCRAMEEVSHV